MFKIIICKSTFESCSEKKNKYHEVINLMRNHQHLGRHQIK
jgi:hypothetical protein